MRPIYSISIFQLLYIFVGCTTATQVYVYDSTTKEPIEDAFVYLNEYKMFNPFNTSNIYLTNKEGYVNISENLRDGQVSIYIGKDGYDLNIFSRDFEKKENIKFFIEKTKVPKVREIFIRESLLANDFKQKLVKDFYLYCKKQNIKFYNFPERKPVLLE